MYCVVFKKEPGCTRPLPYAEGLLKVLCVVLCVGVVRGLMQTAYGGLVRRSMEPHPALGSGSLMNGVVRGVVRVLCVTQTATVPFWTQPGKTNGTFRCTRPGPPPSGLVHHLPKSELTLSKKSCAVLCTSCLAWENALCSLVRVFFS